MSQLGRYAGEGLLRICRNGTRPLKAVTVVEELALNGVILEGDAQVLLNQI